MRQPWIRESGTVSADGLMVLLQSFAGKAEPLILAAWPDRYEVFCGMDQLSQPERLLEVRAVSGQAELWAHRTMLGSTFQWRIADDCTLAERVGQEKMSLWRKEQTQKLDIDTAHKPKNGGQLTTGGRRICLPISSENAVHLALYIGEDDIGMAAVCDFRVMSFVFDERFAGKEV